MSLYKFYVSVYKWELWVAFKRGTCRCHACARSCTSRFTNVLVSNSLLRKSYRQAGLELCRYVDLGKCIHESVDLFHSHYCRGDMWKRCCSDYLYLYIDRNLDEDFIMIALNSESRCSLPNINRMESVADNRQCLLGNVYWAMSI